MRVNVGCGFFGAVFLLAVACGAWSCCQLRDCRYTAALHADTSAGLFIVLQGPRPVTDWCLPASWPSARLAYRVWLKVISRKLAHMDHEMHSVLSVLFPPSLPRFCVSFFPLKSPHLHFGKGKLWSIHWNAEITLMKDVLLNVSKMAKIWIGELITFKLMHLSEAFIQSDSDIAFRVYTFITLCAPWESNTWHWCC